MAVYPDWLLKYKTKGIYANKLSESSYSLYKAHSEWDKDKKRSIRICDGYLGIVTQDLGLVKTRNRELPDIITYEFGEFKAILDKTHIDKEYCSKNFLYYKNVILCASLLNVVYKEYNEYLFSNTYLSLVYKNVNFNKIGSLVSAEITRMTAKVITLLNNFEFSKYKFIHLVKSKDVFKITNIDEYILNIAQVQGVELKYENS
ncbi:MAG: hypothetical protein LBV51_00830 [Acholeplasmatales bacterium]|jgi:hypothetical protein|nr:hypothetical protein [Acholeplasmatales bacterium]